jgi:hypothetical protein
VKTLIVAKISASRFYIIAVLLFFGIIHLIPSHMDEFIMFHRLACQEPAQQILGFREGCEDYEISLFNYEFHRSYSYIGVSSSIIAAPLFLVFNGLWVNFLIGLIHLVLVFIGFAKSFNLGRSSILFGFLSFPIVYGFLHDGGPVRLSALAISWTPVILKKYLDSANIYRFFWLFGLIFLWTIATEDKPYFLYLIPGTVLLSLSSLLTLGGYAYLKRNSIRLVFGIALAAASSVGFLAVLRVDDGSYLSFLISNSPSIDFTVLLNLSGSYGLTNAFADLGLYNKLSFLFAWAYFPHRILEMSSFQIDAVTILIPGMESPFRIFASVLYVLGILGSISIYFLVLRSLRRCSSWRIKSSNLILLLTIFTFWLGAFISGGWAVHHYLYAIFPLHILTLALFRDRELDVYKSVLAFTSVISLLAAWITPHSIWASPEINKVYQIAIKKSDHNSIISCSSWGCYYQYSLLNKNDIPVVFASFEIPSHFEDLESYALLHRKNVYFICSQCSQNQLQEVVPRLFIGKVNTETKDWFLYEGRIPK